MLTFLSPLFLIGLVSAAIPLIIHLSRSRRAKKMQFSTTRFFTDQFLRSYRLSRLKELLLLACRMALCALFAAALARPLLLPKGHSFLMGQSRSIVLVLDNSASMGYVENGVTILERARTAANELIDGLGPGDTASVVLAGRRDAGAEVLFAEPTSELGDVRQAIDAVEVVPLGTDLVRALAAAEPIARSSSAQSKEVYLLSDLQDSGWELETGEAAEADTSEVLHFLVRVRPEAPENVAITAVHYAAARPMVGVPFSIRPHVHNQSGHVRSCDVRLYVDGRKVGERHVAKLEGGRWTVPRFFHTFRTGGWHTGYVEVTDETLAADNRRYFAFEVLDSVKLLAVNGAPSRVTHLDELFFLKTALAAHEKDARPIALDIITPDALGTADVEQYPLVILANVESIAAPAVEKLETYVDRGGSLLVLLGDKTNESFYNRALSAPTRLHGGLLPGRIVGLEGNPSGAENHAFVADVDFDHRALDVFSDPRFANVTAVTFKALWTVDPGASAVLMRASTGSPLLCEKSFGKGRVMLFTSTCDRDWTNFPVRPAFLPWIYRLVSYLSQEPLVRDGFYLTGQRVPIPVSASEGLVQILVKKPDGTVGHATTSNDPGAPLVFDDTIQPGVYAMYSPGKAAAARSFVANLESYESDLRYLDDVLADREVEGDFDSRASKIEAGFKELLPGRPLVSYVEDPGRVTDVSLSARRGLRLWDVLLVLALAVALFEPWLANRISKRHYSQPAGVPEAAASPASRRSRLMWRESESRVEEVAAGK